MYVKVEVEGKHSYAFHSPDQGVTVKFIRFQIEAKTSTKHPHPTNLPSTAQHTMDDVEDVDEKKSQDPGAARFGNFINYYSFNPPENRLQFLPESFTSLLDQKISPICVLDIGCNSGVNIK